MLQAKPDERAQACSQLFVGINMFARIRLSDAARPISAVFFPGVRSSLP